MYNPVKPAKKASEDHGLSQVFPSPRSALTIFVQRVFEQRVQVRLFAKNAKHHTPYARPFLLRRCTPWRWKARCGKVAVHACLTMVKQSGMQAERYRLQGVCVSNAGLQEEPPALGRQLSQCTAAT